jgi:hypothetical protein
MHEYVNYKYGTVAKKGGVTMKMSSLVKIAVFILMLIGAHVMLGMTCNRVQSHYEDLFPPGNASLNLAIWVVGSILLSALISGLVVALVRPLWIIALGFFLSSLAMLLAWGTNIYSALASLIYFLIAIRFSRTVVDEIKVRLNFSVKPIQQEQNLLLFGLALMIGAGFALGYQDAARRSGELIPPAYKQKITDSITRTVQAQLERQSGLGQVENAMVLQGMQQAVEKLWTQADTLLKPYASYLPFVIGALLVWLLNTFLGFIGWLPPRLLSGIIPLLKGIGVTHEVVETKEALRLVLD